MREWAKAIAATLILALVAFTGSGIAAWKTGVHTEESMEDLTTALFETYVVPFEVLSVLLLGALLGALYVGGKQRKEAP